MLAVEVLQVVLIIVAIGAGARLAAARQRRRRWLGVVLLMLAGTAAFSGLALLLAGTLRAEATLAAANLIYLVMLGIGGVVFPLTKFPAAVRPVLRLLPAGALSDGLRSVLQHGGGLPGLDLLVLVVWAVAAIASRRARSAGSSRSYDDSDWQGPLDVRDGIGRFYDGARARTPRLASPGPGAGARRGPPRLAGGSGAGGLGAGALPRGDAAVRAGRGAGVGVHHPDRRRGPAQPVRAGLPGLARSARRTAWWPAATTATR